MTDTNMQNTRTEPAQARTPRADLSVDMWKSKLYTRLLSPILFGPLFPDNKVVRENARLVYSVFCTKESYKRAQAAYDALLETMKITSLDQLG